MKDLNISDNAPQFSIILTTYNREKYIRRSIQSVLEQKLTSWELIIIDDGSEDDTKNIICSYKDKRIKYYYQKNSGISTAKNIGIEKSIGEYICFLDSDDEYLPNHLLVLEKYILKFGHPITMFTTLHERTINGIKDEYVFTFKDSVPCFDNLINIAVNSVCIHNSILRSFKFSIEFSGFGEDTELWLRILKKYSLLPINITTTRYHIHENSMIEKYTLNSLMLRANFFIHLKKEYPNLLSREYLRSRISQYYIGISDQFAREGERKNSMKYLIKLLITDIKATKQKMFWGIIKRILIH